MKSFYYLLLAAMLSLTTCGCSEAQPTAVPCDVTIQAVCDSGLDCPRAVQIDIYAYEDVEILIESKIYVDIWPCATSEYRSGDDYSGYFYPEYQLIENGHYTSHMYIPKDLHVIGFVTIDTWELPIMNGQRYFGEWYVTINQGTDALIWYIYETCD